MNKKQIYGIIYVSVWVLIWGTIGSLVDYPLLQKGVYLAGTIGQYITFVLTGLVSSLIAIYYFPKIMNADSENKS